MSDNNKDEELGIRYILNDTEFVLDSSDLKTGGTNDIIYTDGNQAFVLNGHLVQGTGESPTLVLQEGDDISQYFINDDKGELLIANIQNKGDQIQENEQIIQYIDEDGNVIEQPEIVYINEDGIPLNQDNSSHYQFAELMDTDNPLQDNEEETRVIDLQSFTQDGETPIMELNAADWYQYTVVKDSDLHYAIPPFDTSQDYTGNSINPFIDVSTITGKNLLTGQVVTLESYMDKIQRKMKSIPTNSLHWKKPKHNLNAFLNKKFNLGLTVGGKRLMGKIVHVGNKDINNRILSQEIEIVEQENENKNLNEVNIEDNDANSLGTPDANLTKSQASIDDKIQFQTKLLSKKSDQFQRISKTLSNLMNMDSVRSQLAQRSIQIKIIDRYCDNAKKVTRNVSFISGYMESNIVNNDKNELVEEWTFVPDTLKTEYVRSNAEKKSQIKYPITINLTIITTHQKNKTFVKAILESKNHSCNYCNKIFENDQTLAVHLNEEHKQCEICNSVFQNLDTLMQHKNTHLQSKELKTCNVGSCKKYFMTECSLKKHVAGHKLESFKCPVCPFSGLNETDLKMHSQTHPNNCDMCGEIFINEAEMNVHKKNHHTNGMSVLKRSPATKYYACDVCNCTFSRQSNLRRHVDIHNGAEQLYRCAICGCSYHYISSLTRHVVQNHVQIQR